MKKESTKETLVTRQFMIPLEQDQRLTEMAEQAQVSRAQIVREAIALWEDAHKDQLDQLSK